MFLVQLIFVFWGDLCLCTIPIVVVYGKYGEITPRTEHQEYISAASIVESRRGVNVVSRRATGGGGRGAGPACRRPARSPGVTRTTPSPDGGDGDSTTGRMVSLRRRTVVPPRAGAEDMPSPPAEAARRGMRVFVDQTSLDLCL